MEALLQFGRPHYDITQRIDDHTLAGRLVHPELADLRDLQAKENGTGLDTRLARLTSHAIAHGMRGDPVEKPQLDLAGGQKARLQETCGTVSLSLMMCQVSGTRCW